MVDNVSKQERSNIMRKVRSQSDLENVVSKALWKKGIRYRKNVKSLMGKPDIVIQKYKIVIFIDSCFWHACELHGRMPKSNTEFWESKFERNKERDAEVNKHYLSKNWNILRVWEHELREDFDGTINKIVAFIEHAKK
ncbi:very short patch repair endonuclease [Salipaludibacillus sp. CUR1]|uniref:very short patch repair endonuclease n=1 Tax=Salipaludibacillus sp. CUR1 TaxID=2820003 RepID=UPI001E627273|nr:very short patch repair endonuclease [Salipaludibacillus sp. CUR1]